MIFLALALLLLEFFHMGLFNVLANVRMDFFFDTSDVYGLTADTVLWELTMLLLL